MIYAQLGLLYFHLGTIHQEDSDGADPGGCSTVMLSPQSADSD